MVAPLFGYYLIKPKAATETKPLYSGRFYVFFRRVLRWCLTHRTIVLSGTAALFVLSLGLMKFIPQEFFPPSLRPELIVEMTLPEGSSLQATQKEAARFSKYLQSKDSLLKDYSYYVGEGAPRFVLTIEPVLPANNYAQFVVVAKDTAAREELTQDIKKEMADQYPNVRSNVKNVPLGPPADYPIMLRVSGYDTDKVKAYAQEAAQIIAKDPNTENVFLNWNQKNKVMRVDLDQNKLKTLGISGQTVAQTLYTEISGATVAQYYAPDKTIDIQLRLRDADRQNLATIQSLPVYTGPTTGYVPLEQLGKIRYDAEDGLIWRRDLKPTITINAGIKTGTANDATQKAYDSLADLRKSLPFGYSIDIGGSLEDSQKSLKYLLQPVPIMIILIMTLLMFQLTSPSLMVMALIMAPLGLIGVAAGMLIFQQALGFVAYLGILALGGMIIRNAIILIDQIQKHMAAGDNPWQAIIDSAVMRFRPIMLTAAAAILGMVPLMGNIFWGPMAVAIASGLLIATVLTLLVLPTLYAAWFRIGEDGKMRKRW